MFYLVTADNLRFCEDVLISDIFYASSNIRTKGNNDLFDIHVLHSLFSKIICIVHFKSSIWSFFFQLADAPDIWVVPYYVPAGLSISFVSPLLRPLSQSGRRRWQKWTHCDHAKSLADDLNWGDKWQHPVETFLLPIFVCHYSIPLSVSALT